MPEHLDRWTLLAIHGVLEDVPAEDWEREQRRQRLFPMNLDREDFAGMDRALNPPRDGLPLGPRSRNRDG